MTQTERILKFSTKILHFEPWLPLHTFSYRHYLTLSQLPCIFSIAFELRAFPGKKKKAIFSIVSNLFQLSEFPCIFFTKMHFLFKRKNFTWRSLLNPITITSLSKINRKKHAEVAHYLFRINFIAHPWYTYNFSKKATCIPKEAAEQMIEGLKKQLLTKQASLEANNFNKYKFEFKWVILCHFFTFLAVVTMWGPDVKELE